MTDFTGHLWANEKTAPAYDPHRPFTQLQWTGDNIEDVLRFAPGVSSYVNGRIGLWQPNQAGKMEMTIVRRGEWIVEQGGRYYRAEAKL